MELLVTDDRDLKPYALVDGEWVPDPNPAMHNKRDGLMYCLNDAPCPALAPGTWSRQSARRCWAAPW